MAELASCCTPTAEASCCEPEAKEECCGQGAGCGCSAGESETTADVREAVRQRYAALATVAGAGQDLSLGCGNPVEVAELHVGENVLDLGSGGGTDVLLSAARVGPTGRAFGLDMTDEMLELAHASQRAAGIENVEWLRGAIEDVPLPDDSVDVVISNCVVNLSPDKPRVFAEAARVLRPGGRFAVTDILADDDMDAATRADMAQWTGCVAGALTQAEFERELEAAGFEDAEIVETHRVHEHAGSAIVRARMPASAPP